MAKSESYALWTARRESKRRKFFAAWVQGKRWLFTWNPRTETLTCRPRWGRTFLLLTPQDLVTLARTKIDPTVRKIRDPYRAQDGWRIPKRVPTKPAVPFVSPLDSVSRILDSRPPLPAPTTPLQHAEAQLEAAGAILRTTAPAERRRRRPQAAS